MSGETSIDSGLDRRLAAIEARLDALEKPTREIAYLEGKLIEAAKQYARCITLGFFIDENGYSIRAGKQDMDDLYAPGYLSEMKLVAIDIVRAEASR